MYLKKCFKFISNRICAFCNNHHRNLYLQDLQLVQSLNVYHNHMAVFSPYKACYTGKEIAIIATGPSLNHYKQIPNTINIGVNKAFLKHDLRLQYIFMQDYGAIKPYIEKITSELYKDIKKFYGIISYPRYGCNFKKDKEIIISESIIIRHAAEKFFLYSKYPLHPIQFNTDIDKTWFADGGSVIFSAMQFSLFTNPRRIYLVGCDCSNGYFDQTSDKKIKINKTLYKSWQELKKFADIYYPETEIISVNPVGLKGLFKDLNQ